MHTSNLVYEWEIRGYYWPISCCRTCSVRCNTSYLLSCTLAVSSRRHGTKVGGEDYESVNLVFAQLVVQENCWKLREQVGSITQFQGGQLYPPHSVVHPTDTTQNGRGNKHDATRKIALVSLSHPAGSKAASRNHCPPEARVWLAGKRASDTCHFSHQQPVCPFSRFCFSKMENVAVPRTTVPSVGGGWQLIQIRGWPPRLHRSRGCEGPEKQISPERFR